jgi:single-strand DNA-binding protein
MEVLMAKSLNKVMLIGNLGKDPELRYTNSGVAVATFSLATNETWKDQEGNVQERTEWHSVVAWRKLAEICGEWLKKGRRVYIEGKLRTREWEDKNGSKRKTTEVTADDMIMLDVKGNASGASADLPPTETSLESEPKDDLPF